MMRSLYSGVAGLQNHQTRMDVVGNNVANVNTIGFKKNRVNFQDMIYQNLQGATRPTEDLGGVNPKQVGLGMTVAAIDTIHTQGALQSTGVRSDVAVQGDGFFVLRKGGTDLYTRAGAFNVDGEGFLVNPANGMRVQGWIAETINGQQIINNSMDLGDIVVPLNSKDPARGTETVRLMCNLDKNTPPINEDSGEDYVRQNTYVVSKEIYDGMGNTHTLRMEFTRVDGTANQWTSNVTLNATEEDENPTGLAVGVNGQVGEGTQFTLNFDNNGAIASITDTDGNTVDAGTLNLTVSYNVPDSTLDADGNPENRTFNIEIGTVGLYDNSTTQFASPSTTKSWFQDGYNMGYMADYQIDAAGRVIGIYTNGQRKEVAQMALATFTNPGGLDKVGETNFAQTTNSGDAMIDPAGSANKGSIQAGVLEMSNVDLSAEFVDMIVTQRGFQANSKGIQTSDTMLQELLQLKR
ncbi:MAG: flagellar hook protein FlgE [Spirochaetia bacterium]